MADTYRPLYGGASNYDTAPSSSRSPSARDGDMSGDDSRPRRVSDFSRSKDLVNNTPNPYSPQARQNSGRDSASLKKPTASRDPLTPATLRDDAINNIAVAISEAFFPLFSLAMETMVLKNRKTTAQKELKKKREDYNRSKANHSKFPSAEESQRRARDYAEKECEYLDEEIKAKDTSLKEILVPALSNALPKIVPELLEVQGKAKSDEDSQRKQREIDAELYKFKHRCTKLEDEICQIQLRQSSDGKVIEGVKRDIRELSVRTERLENREPELRGKVEKVESNLATISNCVTSILGDQKKFCDLYEKLPSVAQQSPDRSEIDQVIQTQLAPIQQKIGNFDLFKIKMESNERDIIQAKERLIQLENRLVSLASQVPSPRVLGANDVEFMVDTRTPQINDLKDQLEDVKEGQVAMEGVWGKAIDELRDSLVSRIDNLEKPVSAFTTHCKVNSLAITNLESRYNTINTLEVFKAMSDQFTQEQLPQLEPLQTSVQDMVRRMIHLETIVASHWILPPVVDQRFSAVEQEQQRLSELIRKIESSQSLLSAGSLPLDRDFLAGELRNIKTEISQLDEVCKTRLETCVEKCGEALADIRSNAQEFESTQSALTNGFKKRKLANGYDSSANPSMPVPNIPACDRALENEQKKHRT